MSKLWTPPRTPIQVRQPRVRPGHEWAWRNLMFAHVGEWSPNRNRPGVLYNGADYAVDGKHGKVIETGTTDGGIYYDLGRMGGMVGTQQTIVVLAAIDAYDAWGTLTKVPYRDDNTWSDPFNSINLSRFGTSSGQATFSMVRASTSDDFGMESSSGFLTTDGVWHMYAVTRANTVADFYKDGEFHSSASDAGLSGEDIDWGEHAPIYIGQRNHRLSGEAIEGKIALVLYYNRALTKTEHQALYQDPFGAFRQPEVIALKVPAAPPSSASVSAPTADAYTDTRIASLTVQRTTAFSAISADVQVDAEAASVVAGTQDNASIGSVSSDAHTDGSAPSISTVNITSASVSAGTIDAYTDGTVPSVASHEDVSATAVSADTHSDTPAPSVESVGASASISVDTNADAHSDARIDTLIVQRTTSFSSITADAQFDAIEAIVAIDAPTVEAPEADTSTDTLDPTVEAINNASVTTGSADAFSGTDERVTILAGNPIVFSPEPPGAYADAQAPTVTATGPVLIDAPTIYATADAIYGILVTTTLAPEPEAAEPTSLSAVYRRSRVRGSRGWRRPPSWR